jgi:hypothetical protein
MTKNNNELSLCIYKLSRWDEKWRKKMSSCRVLIHYCVAPCSTIHNPFNYFEIQVSTNFKLIEWIKYCTVWCWAAVNIPKMLPETFLQPNNRQPRLPSVASLIRVLLHILSVFHFSTPSLFFFFSFFYMTLPWFFFSLRARW